MKWQPIETAPKDGTIIRARKNETIRRSRYMKADHIPLYGWHWERSFDPRDGFSDMVLWYPTHWQPIPEPPK